MGREQHGSSLPLCRDGKSGPGSTTCWFCWPGQLCSLPHPHPLLCKTGCSPQPWLSLHFATLPPCHSSREAANLCVLWFAMARKACLKALQRNKIKQISDGLANEAERSQQYQAGGCVWCCKPLLNISQRLVHPLRKAKSYTGSEFLLPHVQAHSI